MCHISLLFYPFSVFGLIFICQEEDDQMDNLINHVLSSDENSRNGLRIGDILFQKPQILFTFACYDLKQIYEFTAC